MTATTSQAAGTRRRTSRTTSLRKLLASRVLAGVASLLILSVIVFLAGQVLPGNPGRAILGNLASEQSVDLLNGQLGVNRPLPDQFTSWAVGVLTGNFGESYQYRTPVAGLLWSAVANSAELTAVILAILVPLSMTGGTLSALRPHGLFDRVWTLIGSLAGTIPEFVSGILLVLVFSVGLHALPLDGNRSGALGLVIAASPVVLVLCGYLSRVMRSSVLEELTANYTRTAVLTGLPRRTILWKHVLRNALVPVLAVFATQVGYLIGGLVVTETLFNRPGVGRLIFDAANQKDFPTLEAGVLLVGAIYVMATLLADVLQTYIDPRRQRSAY